jgi:hypothetical protein
MGRCKAEKRHPKRKENKGGIIGSFEGKRLRKRSRCSPYTTIWTFK